MGGNSDQRETHPCSQGKTIHHLLDQHEIILKRMAQGDTAFELIKRDLTDIKASQQTLGGHMDKFNKRMFVDNGTTSFQTRMDRHERFIRVLLWAMTVIGGVVLTYMTLQLLGGSHG